MTLKYILGGMIGALICAFICGGWYLLESWVVNISDRRWRKKMDKQHTRKEE